VLGRQFGLLKMIIKKEENQGNIIKYTQWAMQKPERQFRLLQKYS
jgi:hypothetical protein